MSQKVKIFDEGYLLTKCSVHWLGIGLVSFIFLFFASEKLYMVSRASKLGMQIWDHGEEFEMGVWQRFGFTLL